MSEQWIVIPKWEQFQHPDAGRSNIPPWIKAYTKLLSDDAYLDLSWQQRGLLHGIWLEYARARCQLRLSTTSDRRRTDASLASLSRRLGQTVRVSQLEALISAGFIEISASKPASTTASNGASNHAGLEKRREEQRPSTSKANPARAITLQCPQCSITAKHERELRDHLENVHWLEDDELEQALATARHDATLTR